MNYPFSDKHEQLSDELYECSRLLLLSCYNIENLYALLSEFPPYIVQSSLDEILKISSKIHVISQILKTLKNGKRKRN